MDSPKDHSSTTPLAIELILCDRNPEALDAWRQQFRASPEGEMRAEVQIRDGDILEAEADAILVPGNSFGFLDGGIELRVCEAMSMELQDELRDRIRSEYAGELLVGQAIVDLTASAPPVVYAPIWRTPQNIATTINVFLALRGALQGIATANLPAIKKLAVPSMGVDPGGMHPLVSARQIRYAYEMAIGERGRGGKNLTRLIRRERKLKSIPGAGREEVATAE